MIIVILWWKGPQERGRSGIVAPAVKPTGQPHEAQPVATQTGEAGGHHLCGCVSFEITACECSPGDGLLSVTGEAIKTTAVVCAKLQFDHIHNQRVRPLQVKQSNSTPKYGRPLTEIRT